VSVIDLNFQFHISHVQQEHFLVIHAICLLIPVQGMIIPGIGILEILHTHDLNRCQIAL
jgi:hypothetical protein